MKTSSLLTPAMRALGYGVAIPAAIAGGYAVGTNPPDIDKGIKGVTDAVKKKLYEGRGLLGGAVGGGLAALYAARTRKNPRAALRGLSALIGGTGAGYAAGLGTPQAFGVKDAPQKEYNVNIVDPARVYSSRPNVFGFPSYSPLTFTPEQLDVERQKRRNLHQKTSSEKQAHTGRTLLKFFAKRPWWSAAAGGVGAYVYGSRVHKQREANKKPWSPFDSPPERLLRGDGSVWDYDRKRYGSPVARLGTPASDRAREADAQRVQNQINAANTAEVSRAFRQKWLDWDKGGRVGLEPKYQGWGQLFANHKKTASKVVYCGGLRGIIQSERTGLEKLGFTGNIFVNPWQTTSASDPKVTGAGQGLFMGGANKIRHGLGRVISPFIGAGEEYSEGRLENAKTKYEEAKAEWATYKDDPKITSKQKKNLEQAMNRWAAEVQYQNKNLQGARNRADGYTGWNTSIGGNTAAFSAERNTRREMYDNQMLAADKSPSAAAYKGIANANNKNPDGSYADNSGGDYVNRYGNFGGFSYNPPPNYGSGRRGGNSQLMYAGSMWRPHLGNNNSAVNRAYSGAGEAQDNLDLDRVNLKLFQQ